MAEAYVAGIAYHLPAKVVTNDDLGHENPDWDMSRIERKIGIRARHIAAPNETALDLAEAACRKLFARMDINPTSVDVLLFCTQTPDHILPTTACILQDRLGLPTTCGALDFNLGCSGYVYGLYMAKAMVVSGLARNVLLVTAETYSKHIHPRDRSVRVLFGDGATATFVTSEPRGARIGTFVLGTDGSGWQNLIIPAGGARVPRNATTCVATADASGSERSPENLFMDGQELFLFTLQRVPEVVTQLLDKTGLRADDVAWYVFHQANAYMNQKLCSKLGLPPERVPLALSEYGNTVSNTIPLTLALESHVFGKNDPVMLVGFGVGYSWGGVMLTWGDVQL